MAAPMTTMPPELIHKICSHFYRDETIIDFDQDWLSSQRQLAVVCRVSKAFYMRIQPFLYRQIYVSLHHLTGVKYLSLLRTLISRPDLGKNVRDIKIHVCIPVVSPGEINQTDMATFLEITRQWPWNKSNGAAVRSDWTGHHQRTQEALVDLLLAHLPKLNIVHLSVGQHPYGSNTQPLAGPSFLFATSKVQGLTSLHVYHHDLHPRSIHPGITHTPQISNFLKYFSAGLGKFLARRCDRPPGSDVFCFDGIQDLALYDVGLNNVSLRLLMESCNGLRRFAYTSWNYATVTPDTCLRALGRHSSTLVDIYLRVTYPECEVVTSGGYQSFHTFTKLENLNVFPLDFEGAQENAINSLPESLKHITLNYWTVAPNNDMIAFVEAATQVYLPKLKTFDVHLCHNRCVDCQRLARYTKHTMTRKLGIVPFKFSARVFDWRYNDPRK